MIFVVPAQGSDIPAILHEARALTETKEETAKRFEDN